MHRTSKKVRGFEHKSHPDYGILQQLLNYQKEVYSRQTKYTPIVPVVFFHGKQKWNIRTNFAQLESEDLLPYTLNFGYILIDLQKVAPHFFEAWPEN